MDRHIKRDCRDRRDPAFGAEAVTFPVEPPQLEQYSSTVAGGIIGIEPTGFLGPECKSFMLSDLSSVEAEACWPPRPLLPMHRAPN